MLCLKQGKSLNRLGSKNSEVAVQMFLCTVAGGMQCKSVCTGLERTSAAALLGKLERNTRLGETMPPLQHGLGEENSSWHSLLSLTWAALVLTEASGGTQRQKMQKTSKRIVTLFSLISFWLSNPHRLCQQHEIPPSCCV